MNSHYVTGHKLAIKSCPQDPTASTSGRTILVFGSAQRDSILATPNGVAAAAQEGSCQA